MGAIARRAIVTGALLAFCGVSSADSIGLTYWGDSPYGFGKVAGTLLDGDSAPTPELYVGRSLFIDPVPDGSALAALLAGSSVSMTLTVNGHAGAHDVIEGYCVDLYQWISPGDYRSWAIVPLAAAPSGGGAGQTMGNAKASALAKLFADHQPIGAGVTADNSAAFSACVWEVVNETSLTYGLGNGNFRVTPTRGGTWNSIADVWLGDLNSPYTPPVLPLYALVNEQTQDFLVLVPVVEGEPVVPEPFTLVTAFLAIGSFGLYVRKHTRRAQGPAKTLS